jgi:multidrug efflux pump
MIIVFVLMSLAAGWMSYFGLPKEGEPDIDIPVLFVSVPFPGISAADSEKLLVKPLETELSDIDGLKTLSATASEGYAGIALEFEFGWDKAAVLADVRDKVNSAEAKFPAGAEQYSINEINFSEFPILVVSLSGDVPERALTRIAKNLQTDVETLGAVLEAEVTGQRDEMLEVLIDPLKLEAYNVTAGELLSVVTNNNLLIAAGEIETTSGSIPIKIPGSFDEAQDVYSLPVKVNGDSVITLGQLADIRLTFEDRTGTARFNGVKTVALQIVKRKGFNHIDTVAAVKARIAESQAAWPQELRESINVDYGLDQSTQVSSMISQLEGSVLTAILLVMIVVLASLGMRSALLVGFAIPTSFLLSFALMAVMEITISNIVMFGLILAVGMLVDGAIVVVEYADKRISEGVGPMRAYTAAAKRMFWPIISSTATTLCAFLPMLFWPGVPGQFMRNLPITLIFVLSASLLVALVYLPVVGGVAGRMSQFFERVANELRKRLHLIIRFILTIAAIAVLYFGLMSILQGNVVGVAVVALACVLVAITTASLRKQVIIDVDAQKAKGNIFGTFIRYLICNPITPVIAVVLVGFAVVTTFTKFQEDNYGVEFFVDSEPENIIVYVRARGNLSVAEKDTLVRQVEDKIVGIGGIQSVFAFAGAGGLNQNTGGGEAPLDTIGQIQIEFEPWEVRGTGTGKGILEEITAATQTVPGIQVELLAQERGPASGKPLHLRVTGDNFSDLQEAAKTVRAFYEGTEGYISIEDSLPLPGIDWEISVDVAKAGRYGANVATVGTMVQLVTRGLLLDTMRVDSSDEEIDIRVRVPEKDRLLSTLETLRVRTTSGLIPLSNFIDVNPVQKLGQINRVDTKRYFDIKADISEGMNPGEEIASVSEWLDTEKPLPASVKWEWKGDQEEQAESQAFLGTAFAGALGLMFVILLAQFNSFYNAFLVLLAVILSTTGVLIGMLFMQQPFSIIMTGTGIVALAGIVVNNNIVLIDTYQEYCQRMPRLDAIARTAEARIRPVLLTTITTMAGLAPMMFGISINFAEGGFSVDSPTALWWKQLATAVVWGLGVATILTLIFTPSMLAIRVWIFDRKKGMSPTFWDVIDVPDEAPAETVAPVDVPAPENGPEPKVQEKTKPKVKAVARVAKKATKVIKETKISDQVNQTKTKSGKSKPTKAAE